MHFMETCSVRPIIITYLRFHGAEGKIPKYKKNVGTDVIAYLLLRAQRRHGSAQINILLRAKWLTLICHSYVTGLTIRGLKLIDCTPYMAKPVTNPNGLLFPPHKNLPMQVHLNHFHVKTDKNVGNLVGIKIIGDSKAGNIIVVIR